MSDSEDDKAFAGMITLVGMGIVSAIMGIRGCVVQQGLTPELTPIEVAAQDIKVPGTKFSPPDDSNVIELQRGENVPVHLEEGTNVIHMSCKKHDGKTYEYQLAGASGDVTVGQKLNFAGSQDDVHVQKTNGETIVLRDHCPGGKSGEDISTVFIDIDR